MTHFAENYESQELEGSGRAGFLGFSGMLKLAPSLKFEDSAAFFEFQKVKMLSFP